MASIKINEIIVDLNTFVGPSIEVGSNTLNKIEAIDNDIAVLKKIVVLGYLEKNKYCKSIGIPELSKLKQKFRVNFEQVILYKIIENINFFTYIIVYTDGFSYDGIEFLEKIKGFFEFNDKRIFIIKKEHVDIDFDAVSALYNNHLKETTLIKRMSRFLSWLFSG